MSTPPTTPLGYIKRTNDFGGPAPSGSGGGSAGSGGMSIEDEGSPLPQSDRPGEGIGFDHAELGGLGWTESGHTGAASSIAGFDSTGKAKEYPTARNAPVPHAVAMTEGTGRLAYAICPSSALEFNVIALSLMAG